MAEYNDDITKFIDRIKREDGILPPENAGFFGGLWKNTAQSFVSGVRGIGSTLEETELKDFGIDSIGKGLRQWGEDVLESHQDWNPGPNEGVGGYVGRAIGSGIGSTAVLAPAMGADAVFGTKGLASFAMAYNMTFGDNLKRNREAYGPDNEEKSMGLAALESSIDALTEVALGTVPMFGKTLKGLTYAGKRQLIKGMYKAAAKDLGRTGAQRFFLGLAKNGMEEGAEEAVQYINSWAWRALGGDPNNEFSWKELGDNTLQGAIGGAALGVVGGANDVQTYGKQRPWLIRAAAKQTGENIAFSQDIKGQEVKGVYTPEGDFVPVAENPDASGRDAMEALYEEFGIPLSRMTKQEQQTEGIGRVGEDETNGLYDKKTGEVKINPDNEGEVFSHGHEFDHWMTANHPDIAAALHKIMDEEVNNAGKALQTNPEELHADLLGHILNDPGTLFETSQKLNEQQIGFGEKFLESLIEFAKKAMAYLKQNPGLKGAREYFNNYKRVKNAAEDALIEIRKRQKQAEQSSKVENAELNADLSNKDGETGALKAENAENMQNPTVQENRTVQKPENGPVQSIPVSDLNIDPARFQFKSKANKKTGVDESNQIGGEWDEKTAGNIYVWEDKTGKKFVVNGHHRFALAKEKGVKAVNAIVDREADGVTAEQAKRNGTLINIRDEQGDIEDYAAFIRNEKMDEARAEKEGILKRQKGRIGFVIGRYSSDNLYHISRSGDMDAGTAATIADIARGDEGLEAAGIKAAKNGMSASQLREFMKLLKNTPKKNTGSAQGDLFGFDDSAIRQAETLSGLAAKHIRAVKEKINAAKGAVNNPEAAKKLGVTTKKNAQALLDNARKEAAEWENWHTNPKLYSQLMDEAGFTEKKTDAPKTEEKQAGTPVVKENLTTEARFNQDSDTPLLTPEEDSRDFQLIDETSEEAKAREAKVARDEAARIERAKEEARRNAPDLLMESQNVGEIPAMTEDEYLGSMGLSMPLSDYMTDKQKIPHGETESQRKQRIREADRIANEYAEARKKAKAEYRRKIENGELREPTAIEKLEKVAAGNSDNESVQAARRALEKRRKKHEVPTNYKTFDKDGNWKITGGKNIGQLLDDFVAALKNHKFLRVTTPKGDFHIGKFRDVFYYTDPNGRIRMWAENNVRSVLDKFIVSNNPKVQILEESEADAYRSRKIQKDGSLLKAGDYAVFNHKGTFYEGEVASVGKKNVKLKTHSNMYGKQMITLPMEDYKAHYAQSPFTLSESALEEFNREYGSPEEYDRAKKSFMVQKVRNEGKQERKITSGTYERAQKQVQKDVESFVGDGKQYSTKKKDIVLVGAVPKDMPSPDNPKVLRDWLKDFYRGKKKPKNSDIGWDISVPATGLKETLNNIYRNRANYPKDLHYRTLPVIDEMLQKAKHDHDEETQSGKKGDYISIFNVPVDFGNDGVYNARMVVKHFGDDKNYYDHRLTKFEALPDSRLQSDDSGRLNNASDSSNLTEKSEKSTDPEEKNGKDFTEEDGSRFQYSIRKKEPPKQVKTGYKVFCMFKSHPGELFPPMVANPGGASTPVGVWLDADAAPRAEDSKTGRPRVQSGGKGTNAGRSTLAYRPGWHLGELPEASQFLVKDPETGRTKALFPENFVFAECEFAADKNYQDEAMSYGYNASGKFQHSLAGLPRIPEDGFYTYRTNPDPNTHPWFISGAMRVKRLLTDDETAEILRRAGSEIVPRKGGKLDLEKWGFRDRQFSGEADDGKQYSKKRKQEVSDMPAKAISEEQKKEILEAYDYAMNGEPVARLSGHEFQKDGTPLTEKVTRFYKEQYNGKAFHPELGEVKLDLEGVKDSLGHGIGSVKAAAYAAVPQMIEKGKIFDRQKNWKGRGYDTVVMVAPLEISGVSYVGEVVVKQGVDRQGFYLHEVEVKEKLADVFKTANGSTSPVSRLIISHLIEKIKSDSGKNQTDSEIQHSMKHRNQVNPIREAGPIRDEYQNRLDNSAYEKRSDEEVTRLAEQRIKSFGGFDEVSKIILEGDFKLNSDVGQRIVQLVLNSKEFKKLDVDQRDKIADVYIKNLGTEIARALAARRLGALRLDDIKSVQAHVNAFLAKIDKKNPMNKLREDCLKQFGFDIESLPDEILKDNNNLDELFRRLAAEKASDGNKFYEFWINAILSGPSTHIANIFGNTANAAYELGIKRFTEALINTVARRKDGATFGEFKAMINALNWREAWRRAKFAYDFETLTTAGKLENVRAAIGGKTGQIIRTPGRLLRAADEFARALIVPVESAAYAYRQAKSNGLSGESMRQFIEAQLKDEKSEAFNWGTQRAIELTFQEDPGNAVKQLIRWRDSGGFFGNVLKYTLPFMKTPANILKQGVRKSIFGGYALAGDVAQIARGKKSFDSKTIGLVAEQLIAWGTLAMIYGMTSGDDDDDPIITGSSAPYGSSEQKFKAGQIPPYSIRIGDTWYSYQRIEPLATGLAFIADGLNALRNAKKGEDGTKIIKKLGYGAKQLIFDKSFLDSLGELNKIASDPERSVEKFVTRYISSWVPNVAKQVTSALMDDSIRDTKSRRNGLEWWEDQFQTVVNSMGIPISAPKYDYLGREIRKDDLEGAWRLARLIPIRRITPEKEPVDQLFMNYNNKGDNADEYYPGIPSFRFVRNGEKLYFSGENYAEFARRSGELAHKQINNAFRHGLLHKDNPTKRDIDLIKKIFRRARKQIREEMYRAKKFNR